MVFSYNREKTPARPECQLDIINPRDSKKLVKGINAIADTGADMTMIPDNVTENLGNLIEGESIKMRGVNGIKILKTYIVNAKVGDYKFSNLQVVAIAKDHALIGRDILNQNKAVFNASQDCWKLDCGESGQICP